MVVLEVGEWGAHTPSEGCPTWTPGSRATWRSLEAKVAKVKPGSSYMGPCTNKLTVCSVRFHLSRPGMKGGFLLDSGRFWARTV